jgi:hypothetical protein
MNTNPIFVSTIKKKMTQLTTEQTKRVNSEILDTQKKLNNELSYSKDLQNLNRILELQIHIKKLNNMILQGWNAPKFN